MIWTDEPSKDAGYYDCEMEREQEEMYRNNPICDCCGEKIRQDKAIFWDNRYFCEDCEDVAIEEMKEYYTENL